MIIGIYINVYEYTCVYVYRLIYTHILLVLTKSDIIWFIKRFPVLQDK